MEAVTGVVSVDGTGVPGHVTGVLGIAVGHEEQLEGRTEGAEGLQSSTKWSDLESWGTEQESSDLSSATQYPRRGNLINCNSW